MAKWVKCTRASDNLPVYLNLDTVRWLRRNEQDKLSLISWGSGDKDHIRVVEQPEEIFGDI
jgi:hypothetical protein